VLYLNSFFSPWFTVAPLLLRALRVIPRRPVVIAPRGEFAPAALAIKARKKAAFLAVARWLRLYADVTWQASSAYEEADIRRTMGSDARVLVAPDLPAPAHGSGDPVAGSSSPPPEPATGRPLKQPGSLNAVFLGRIVPMKNLLGALHALSRVRGGVQFHIYGPDEDEAYWQECRREIEALPRQISVRYHGALDPHLVPATLREHHILFLPSLGENFGHAIHEAMAAGCPVLISDRTPWRDLEALHAGWDVSLAGQDGLVTALQRCIDMNQETYARFSEGARRLARERSADAAAVAANLQLFEAALTAAQGPGDRA
jgi:glycosyltransferase involved in cell wall biosynthesis